MSDPILDAIVALDDDFNFFSSRRQPPDEAAIAALEAELERPLDPAHRRFVAACGCAAVLVKDEVWPPPVAYEIRPAWQMIRGIEIFGAAPPGHPLSAVTARDALWDRGADEDLLPVAKRVGAAEYLCTRPDGTLVWWTHDGEAAAGGFDAEVLAALATLVADKARIKVEGVQRS